MYRERKKKGGWKEESLREMERRQWNVWRDEGREIERVMDRSFSLCDVEGQLRDSEEGFPFISQLCALNNPSELSTQAKAQPRVWVLMTEQ